MIVALVTLLLVTRDLQSSVPAGGEMPEPETRIKIKLPAPVRKRTRDLGTQLPPDWPLRAANALSKKTEDLSNCFKSPGLKGKQVKFIALLSVDQKGEANWLDREQAPVAMDLRSCIADVVARLRFPNHSLASPIQIRVPLELGLPNQEVTTP